MNDAAATDARVRHAIPSRGRSGRRALAAVLVLGALGIACLLFWRNGANMPSTEQPRPVLTVAVAAPSRVTWPENLSAQGAIAPWQEASIGTQIGSYKLVEVRVNVGDRVRRGQVLAQLDPALLRAEEAQLVARHEQATINDRRARALQEVGGISDQEALQFATESRTATALVAAKRLELRYTSIVAPDDGVISARAATLGAVMPAGQELFRMIRQNRLEWRGELTAPQLNAVAAGQPVALQLPDGSVARAVVRQVAPMIDAQTRLAIVYADLVPGSPARAGMYAAGEIAVGASPALIVPAECLLVRDGRSYVVVIAGTGKTPKVALRAVTTGRRKRDTVEILRGLTGTERLVLRGGAFLNDGDVVRVARVREGRL